VDSWGWVGGKSRGKLGFLTVMCHGKITATRRKFKKKMGSPNNQMTGANTKGPCQQPQVYQFGEEGGGEIDRWGEGGGVLKNPTGSPGMCPERVMAFQGDT